MLCQLSCLQRTGNTLTELLQQERIRFIFFLFIYTIRTNKNCKNSAQNQSHATTQQEVPFEAKASAAATGRAAIAAAEAIKQLLLFPAGRQLRKESCGLQRNGIQS